MTNDRRRVFRFYSRADLARSGVVGTVWVIFYIMLALYAGFWPGHAPKLAAGTDTMSAAAESGMTATLRPHHDRPGR